MNYICVVYVSLNFVLVVCHSKDEVRYTRELLKDHPIMHGKLLLYIVLFQLWGQETAMCAIYFRKPTNVVTILNI